MLIIAMLISMATTALAANNDGSITITNATIGKDYAVYKVFDLTYSPFRMLDHDVHNHFHAILIVIPSGYPRLL